MYFLNWSQWHKNNFLSIYIWYKDSEENYAYTQTYNWISYTPEIKSTANHPSIQFSSVAQSCPSLQPYKLQHTSLTVVKTVIYSSLSYSAFHPFPPHLKILVTELL